MPITLISRSLALCLIVFSAIVCAQNSSRVPISMSVILAEQRARDAETATGIATLGASLYEGDSRKLDVAQYCAAAMLLADQGEFRLSVREASKALHLGLKSNNRKALAYARRDLAYVYSLAGDLERSSYWAEEALKSSLELRGAPKIDVSNELLAPIYKVLGDIEARRGNHDAARKHYVLARSEVGMFSSTKVLIILAQAQLEQVTGNSKVARDLFENYRNGDFAPLALRGLAEIALKAQRPEEAEKLFEEAAKRADKDPYQLMWARLGLAKLRAVANPKTAREEFDSAIAAAESLRGGFHSIEVRSGFFGNIQDIFDDAVAFGVRNNQPEWALEVSEKSRARSTLDQIRRKAGEAPEAQSTSATLTARQLRVGMPKDAVMVVYHVTRDATFAWTVTADRIVGHELPIASGPLAERVAALRHAITSVGREDSIVASRSLYADLIKPLALPNANVLILVPHRMLHLLPFVALHNGKRYLIEDTALATHLSATAFVEAIAKSGLGQDQLLAFGNPDRDNPAEDLPGAEAEVKAIAGQFDTSQVYTRGNATKTRLLELAPGASVVHVASHASVDEIDPIYSQIHLAKLLGKSGDVEAHEILKLDLKRVSLVVLSACSSGLGRVAAGEEFLGFKRSFIAAGARRLLVSLWPVADDSTARTMELFYAKRGTFTSAEALRVAQLDLLRNAATADPFFWAPFVLVGDYR